MIYNSCASAIDRALQPVTSFDGFEWIVSVPDFRHTLSVEFHGLCIVDGAGLIPAGVLGGYFIEAQRQLIDKTD